MEFIIGYDFSKYGYTLDELREEIILELELDGLDSTEEEIVESDPFHLIAMIKDNQVLGWAIWHESNTREHYTGFPRDDEDIKILEDLTNGMYEFIELHELWVKKAYRKKGYGEQFFDFFEKFVITKGYNRIVYYTDNESAIYLCRKRGYKEKFNDMSKWHTFFKLVSTSLYSSRIDFN